MRYTTFAVAALMLVNAGCSNDAREPSFVSEAQAASFTQKDYGWQTTPEFSAGQQEPVREYY
jgi:hypothetical protein